MNVLEEIFLEAVLWLPDEIFPKEPAIVLNAMCGLPRTRSFNLLPGAASCIADNRISCFTPSPYACRSMPLNPQVWWMRLMHAAASS
eukprot:1451031-Karenia_brevis.AAC.1